MSAVDVLASELNSKVDLDSIAGDYVCEPRLGMNAGSLHPACTQNQTLAS